MKIGGEAAGPMSVKLQLVVKYEVHSPTGDAATASPAIATTSEKEKKSVATACWSCGRPQPLFLSHL